MYLDTNIGSVAARKAVPFALEAGFREIQLEGDALNWDYNGYQ